MNDDKKTRMFTLTLVFSIGLLMNVHEACGGEKYFTSVAIQNLMKKVNTYTQNNPYKETDRNWIRGTYYTGVLGAYKATGDKAYLDQALTWGKKHQWQVGTEKSGANRLFCAMSWAGLYLIDPDPKMIAPTIAWLKTDAPNSPGCGKVWYGHAPAPHDSPLYSDSLYGAPVFAMLYKATGDQKYLDILNEFFWNVTETVLDNDEDLYYRDPSYIDQKSPNGKKILWSRGNGWVFAALPRILKYLPRNNPDYPRYVDLYKRMAKTLASRQHQDGLWRSNLADPDHYRMPESSGTAFFTYGFAWGINQGILGKEVYLPVVIKAWNGLACSVHPNGKLGWVQPVDAQPRPSLPATTHEYAAGLFLLAGSEVFTLAQSGVMTPDVVAEYIPDDNSILPSIAVKKGTLKKSDHPLADKINSFLKRQQESNDFAATGLTRKDYLDVIASQVKAMRKCQDPAGRIIDPMIKKEMQYSTPCYAHCVAVLARAGYPISKELIQSGMKALDVSLEALTQAKAASGHGDFYTWPALFAYELLGPMASPQRKEKWSNAIAGIDIAKSYSAYNKPFTENEHQLFYKTYEKGGWSYQNWNLVNAAGEFLRALNGFTNLDYVDFSLTMQLPHFNAYGMYNEGGNPFPYDLFARHYVTGMLHRGYRSFAYTTYRDLLWKGAWTSLFIQSPTGQLPTGHRSSHHIWNEAEQAVVFEIYATQYARAGMTDEAGAFKRAAHLSLASVKNWIRPDGTGYIVKNKYPIEDRHGYERYSQHACYNLLACSMLAQAWQFADDAVKEKPCPADLGGFALTTPGFHKVFANAGGTYIEYDTSGDHKYNPTGLIRIHLKGGHPQLGPSDGCAPLYSGKGINYAVGPAWKDAKGNWTKLADLTAIPEIKVLEESLTQTMLKITYKIKESEVTLTERITVKPHEVLVADQLSGKNINQLRIYYPMLVFNGKDKTKTQMDQKTLRMQLEQKNVSFEILNSPESTLTRTGQILKHRNGLVEMVYFDTNEKIAQYRIATTTSKQ